MTKFKKALLGLALVALVSPFAKAVWDSTTGNMPNNYALCFGAGGTACLTGSSVNNFLGIGNASIAPTSTLSVNGTFNATGQALFTTNLSSFTTGAVSGTYAQTTLVTCVAGSSVTLTLPSTVSTIWVGFSGSSSSTVLGSTVTVGVLIDGAYVTVAGKTETSSKGLMASVSALLGGGDENSTFGPIPVTGLTAGATHNICMTEASTSGSVTFDAVSATPLFTAYFLP